MKKALLVLLGVFIGVSLSLSFYEVNAKSKKDYKKMYEKCKKEKKKLGNLYESCYGELNQSNRFLNNFNPYDEMK